MCSTIVMRAYVVIQMCTKDESNYLGRSSRRQSGNRCNFRADLSSLYLGGKTKWRLNYLLLRGVNKARSAKRCELSERTALCKPSEESKPIKKNANIFSNIAKFFWHIANGTFSNILERDMAVGT